MAAYGSNQAGQAAAIAGGRNRTQRRELGDTSQLVDTALGYLFGSEQTITVAGAEHPDDKPTDEPARALAVQDKLRGPGEGQDRTDSLTRQ
ncbi:hypothetical protein [Streptomyces rhizosphaericus]|uniref:Uncharacterized protein n=1 Tax=Streptomyces rhizosphaericus TaxID=114699 RepID=A0A6G4AGV9_9ACTN|nr:hypothetical protein [Streptomyces rhizosphaericus]NEW72555.1 hypothetical protein [Streptomyces rhizosphaericus]